MRCAAQLALAFALLTISIGAGLFLSSGNTLRGQVASPHFHIFVKEVGTSDSPFIDISENTGLAISTPYSAPFQFLISVPSARWMELPLDNTLIRVSAKKDGQEVMDGIENSSEVNAAAVFYDSPYPPLCSLEYPCLTSLVFMSAAAVIPGTYNITISANDGTDATSAAFTWTVLPEESNGSASSKEVISPLPSSAPDSNTPPSSSPPSASVPASQASASASSVPTSQGSASTASAPASAASATTDASSSEESQEDTQKKVFCCDVVTESTTPVSFFLRVYIPSLWEKSKWPTCKASVFVQSFEQAKVLCDRLLQEKAQRPTAPTDGDNGTGWDGNSDGEEEGGGGEGGEGGGRGGEDGSDDTADDDGGGGGGSSSAGGGGDECCVDADGTISDPLPPPSTFAGKALTAAKEAVEWVIDVFKDVELNPQCSGDAVLTTGAQCEEGGGGGGGGGGGQLGECADGMDNDTDDFVDADDPDCSDFDGENSTYNPERFERPCEAGEASNNPPVASLLAQGVPCNPPDLGWACCFNNRTCRQYSIPSPYPSSINDLPCLPSNMFGVTQSPLGGRPIFGVASAATDSCRSRCGQPSEGGSSSVATYPGQRVCCSRTTSTPRRPTCSAMPSAASPESCLGHLFTTEPPQNWADPMAACRNECGFSRFCCNQLDGTWKEFFVTMNNLSPCTIASTNSLYGDVPAELQGSFPSFLSTTPAYDLNLPSTAPACPIKRICCDHVAGEWLVTTNQTCRAASPPRPQVLFAGGEDWAVDPLEGPYNKNSFNKCLRFMICANVTKNKCEATTSNRPCSQLGPDQYMFNDYPYSVEGLAQCQSDVQPDDPPSGDHICCRRTTSTVPRFACVSSYQRYCNDQIGAGQVSVKEFGNTPDARARCSAECPTTIWCYSKKDDICKSWPFPPDTSNISAACLGFCGAMTKESCEANCK